VVGFSIDKNNRLGVGREHLTRLEPVLGMLIIPHGRENPQSPLQVVVRWAVVHENTLLWWRYEHIRLIAILFLTFPPQATVEAIQSDCALPRNLKPGKQSETDIALAFPRRFVQLFQSTRFPW